MFDLKPQEIFREFENRTIAVRLKNPILLLPPAATFFDIEMSACAYYRCSFNASADVAAG